MKVVLKHSTEHNKLPNANTLQQGEITINCASGVGASFISAKKADNTIATFREDDYWSNIVSGINDSISELRDTVNSMEGQTGYQLTIDNDGTLSCISLNTGVNTSTIDNNGILSFF